MNNSYTTQLSFMEIQADLANLSIFPNFPAKSVKSPLNLCINI